VDGSGTKQLTWNGTANLGPVWSPDGECLAYVTAREGDKPNGIAIIPVNGGEGRIVCSFPKMPSDLAWDPSGKRIAFTMEPVPDDAADSDKPDRKSPKVRVITGDGYKADGRGVLGDEQRQVHLVEIESGAVLLLTSGSDEHVRPQWSPNGKLLAVSLPSHADLNSSVGVIEVATGNLTCVCPRTWMTGARGWSPDSSSVIFLGSEGFAVQPECYRYDIADGTLRKLASDFPFSPEFGNDTLCWRDQDTVMVPGVAGGKSGLWSIDSSSGEVTLLSQFDTFRPGATTNAAGDVVVQCSFALDSIGELVTYIPASGESGVLTTANESFRSTVKLGRTEPATVECDGETIRFWIIYPPGFDEQRSYPVILHVHGGPHGYFWEGFEATGQYLAAKGYIVVAPNPRGSGSYGQRFAEMVRGDWGGGDWRDVQAALDAVLEREYADADRTGIVGYSYGGFLTAWAIGQTQRFKAAVCGAPVYNLVSFRGTSDVGAVFGDFEWEGTWPENREWLVDHSPSTYVHNATTPTLIVHGEADHRCPIGQGEEMFIGLLEAGVTTEFIRYPGASHGTVAGEPLDHAVDLYTRIGSWFDRFL
jgi:dipeptidyl aminopeptidase/acylaminoacyl peptidase